MHALQNPYKLITFQGRKDLLVKSMSELPHSDNMSPEKKKTLELIKRDLREGSNGRR
jgi:hypothetical protein